MAVEDDIARIGWVLDNYDSVDLLTEKGKQIHSSEFLDMNHKSAPQIRFIKKIDGTYYVVESVFENGHKKLWVQSAYLQKNEDVTQTPAEGMSTNHETNAQSASASPSSNNSISENGQIVNAADGAVNRGRKVGWDGREVVTEAKGKSVTMGRKTYVLLGYDANGSPVYQDAEVLKEQAAKEKASADQDTATQPENGQESVENSENHDTIKLPDIQIGRSLGAKAKNYQIMDLSTGEMFNLVEGTNLQNVEVFAGKGVKTPYHNAHKYADAYGGKIEDWQHVKGNGWIAYTDGERYAEIHWSQCEGIGKHDLFIKRWKDES